MRKVEKGKKGRWRQNDGRGRGKEGEMEVDSERIGGYREIWGKREGGMREMEREELRDRTRGGGIERWSWIGREGGKNKYKE